MEEWLAQLEMEMDRNPHHHEDYDQSESNEIIRADEAFDEEIAAVLGGPVAGDHFPYDPSVLSVSGESNASNHNSPGGGGGGGGGLDMDYTFLAHYHSLPPNDINNNNNANNDALHLGARFMGGSATPDLPVQQQQHHHQSSSSSGSMVLVPAGDHDQDDDDNDVKKKMSKKGRGGGGGGSRTNNSGNTKRKREPNQVQDHIMAERKRRELLSTQFISLSSILPGLKKTDKTSVLGEAIKYMKELQEKVKVLEEVAAKRKVESVVVVKKSHIVVADEAVGDNEAISSSVDDTGDSLQEIEVKVWDKSMLIKLYCQTHQGILPKLFHKLENLHLSVVNSSVIPFGTLALDITILAQMNRETNVNVKDVITSLRSAMSTVVP